MAESEGTIGGREYKLERLVNDLEEERNDLLTRVRELEDALDEIAKLIRQTL